MIDFRNRLSPSVLAADFGDLRNEVKKLAKLGCSFIHYDVMDGKFVRPITFGADFISAARSGADGKHPPLSDVHLMIDEPERHIGDFADATSDGDYITFHVEATRHSASCCRIIREFGRRVGVALNPGTSPYAVEELLPFADMILVMCVNPGYGGQKFIEESAFKVRRISEMRLRGGLDFLISVDGGVGLGNFRNLREAGADIFVSGSSFFGCGAKAAFLKNFDVDNL